ncbi:ABC transporter ATP-binding protein [Terribacillus halophilus]|uniref:ABC transporter ATP-binding protein n=1 Tax=Terribacillus halophilus TaxID=361279 RepID=UPI0009871351|nr:ABC transporter ATP-binding protein [Terribacillus halophilus]
MITLKGVTIAKGKHYILNDITCTIKKGELIGLIGPSGSGKTTMFRALAGIIKVKSGQIKIKDKEQPTLEVSGYIGYMAQNDALYSELTAEENLLYFGALHRLKGKELKERVDKLLHFVDLYHVRKRKIAFFSGGMKRRLSLAIALIHDPDILLLDEPTVGIDPKLKLDFWQEFKRLKKAGKTILLSTHLMDEAEVCDRLLFMRNGKLSDAGTPEKLIQHHGSVDVAFLKEAQV